VDTAPVPVVNCRHPANRLPTRAWLSCAAALALALALPLPSQAADAAALRAASCVAALKVRAEPLAERVKSGDPAAERLLFPVVRDSFAFVGDSYKHGMRTDEANQLLEAAEKQLATLAPAELQRLQDGCQAEGQRLLARASGIERTVVDKAAQRRIGRLRQ
jgi:hypothetical protein